MNQFNKRVKIGTGNMYNVNRLDETVIQTSTSIANNLETEDFDVALGASQGVILKSMIDAIEGVAIANNLTTDSNTIALGASQGVVIKAITDDLGARLTDAETAISTLQTDLTTAEGDITTLQGDITTINTHLTSIDENITGIHSDITTLITRTTDSSTGNAALGARVGTLESQMTTANSNISSLQSSRTTDEANIATLQSQMTTANSNISTNTSNISTINSIVTNGTTGNSALGSRVSTLESRTTDVSIGNSALGSLVNDSSKGNNALYAAVSSIMGSSYTLTGSGDISVTGTSSKVVSLNSSLATAYTFTGSPSFNNTTYFTSVLNAGNNRLNIQAGTGNDVKIDCFNSGGSLRLQTQSVDRLVLGTAPTFSGTSALTIDPTQLNEVDFGIATLKAYSFLINNNEMFRIQESGITSQTDLNVFGSAQLSDTVSLNPRSGTTDIGPSTILVLDGTGTNLFTSNIAGSGNTLKFQTNTTDRLQIDDSGVHIPVLDVTTSGSMALLKTNEIREASGTAIHFRSNSTSSSNVQDFYFGNTTTDSTAYILTAYGPTPTIYQKAKASGTKVVQQAYIGGGSATDVTTLDNNGLTVNYLKIGTTGQANSGGLRMNGTNLEYYNGTAWTVLATPTLPGAGVNFTITSDGAGGVTTAMLNCTPTSGVVPSSYYSTVTIPSSCYDSPEWNVMARITSQTSGIPTGVNVRWQRTSARTYNIIPTLYTADYNIGGLSSGESITVFAIFQAAA